MEYLTDLKKVIHPQLHNPNGMCSKNIFDTCKDSTIQALLSTENGSYFSEKAKFKLLHFPYKNLIKNFEYISEIWTSKLRI